MSPTARRELGSGVRLVPLADGGLVVRSDRLPLPWSIRAGRTTGTAVMVGDDAYEVVACRGAGTTETWTLRPWPESEAMRGVFRLDEDWVASRARQREVDLRAGRLRLALLPLTPLLGLLPASIQSSWETRWGFPAATSTMMSALLELAVATVGIVHALAAAFGGTGVLPSRLGWLGVLGPILAVEAVVRLKHVAALREPIGSALLLPLHMLAPSGHAPDPAPVPEVRAHDPEHGSLQLWSPVHRLDWTSGGLLSYRGRQYELVSLRSEGRGWVYTFSLTTGRAGGAALRLMPPPARPVERAHQRPSRLLRTTLITALACLAPREIQLAWSREVGAPASLFTVLGAAAELVGGLVNLQAIEGSTAPLSVVVNGFFLVEGTARFGALMLRGEPVGSLLGLALRPLLERLVMESTTTTDARPDP